MAKRRPNIQVILSYEELLGLLAASEKVDEFERENALLKEQVLALRMIQSECMEKIRELEHYL